MTSPPRDADRHPDRARVPSRLDGAGLTGALLTVGGVYLVAMSFPLVLRVWRELDVRPVSPSPWTR
jgi:hypothetical protein